MIGPINRSSDSKHQIERSWVRSTIDFTLARNLDVVLRT